MNCNLFLIAVNVSVVRNLSDSDDPSRHLSELDVGRDIEDKHNLNVDSYNFSDPKCI